MVAPNLVALFPLVFVIRILHGIFATKAAFAAPRASAHAGAKARPAAPSPSSPSSQLRRKRTVCVTVRWVSPASILIVDTCWSWRGSWAGRAGTYEVHTDPMFRHKLSMEQQALECCRPSAVTHSRCSHVWGMERKRPPSVSRRRSSVRYRLDVNPPTRVEGWSTYTITFRLSASKTDLWRRFPGHCRPSSCLVFSVSSVPREVALTLCGRRDDRGHGGSAVNASFR